MEVVERLPSGLSAGALAAAARRAPRRARSAAARVIVGSVLVVCGLAGLPAGPVVASVGFVVAVSALGFVAKAGAWSVPSPSLVLDARPAWGGVRYSAWRLEADDLSHQEVAALVDAVRVALDERAGPTAEVGDARVTRVAWGLGDEPTIDAGDGAAPRRGRSGGRGDGGWAPGIWLRIDRADDGSPPVVTFLATEGRATDVLRAEASAAATT